MEIQADPKPAAPDLPARIGRYRITGLLGSGAMGIVYKATDPVIRRPVAIKAIRNLRAERNVPKDARVEPIIVATGPVADMLRHGERYLRSLAPAESVLIVDSAIDRPAECAVAVLPDAEIIVTRVARIERHASTGKLKRFVALTD